MHSPIPALPGIIELSANQPAARPYLGGSGIARFRGIEQPDSHVPEDFLGSATEVFAGGGVGLTVLPDGRTLREALAGDPVGFLGADLAETLPVGQCGVLTKLLSTDGRLFIHAHPDDAFATRHGLGVCGKTESWLILDIDPAHPAEVLLGFRRDVDRDELAQWFEEQDVAAMTEAMHRIPVAPGDTFHVPAGLPHGIGPGITLLELQQPTDLSILLEYEGYPGIDRSSALLGISRDTALSVFRRETLESEELDELRATRSSRGRAQQLFPDAADNFYTALRFRPDDRAGAGSTEVPAAFSIAVVLGGTGRLSTAADSCTVGRGSVLLVRHDAGPLRIDATLDVVLCSPAPPLRAA